MKRLVQHAFIALAAVSQIGWPALARAQIMTSEHYRVPFDALSGGGLRSTSESYVSEGTVAEAGATTGEDLSSPNYLGCVGYQCLKEEAILMVTYAVQAGACDGTSSSSPPYDIALGTLSTGAVTTAVNRICVRVSANAPDGEVVQIRDAYAGLASSSVPVDKIDSNSGTLSAGTEGYGVCSSNVQNGFSAAAPFSGNCDTVANHDVGGLTTTNQTVWAAPGFVTNAYGELLVKGSISAVTPAHGDYQDTLTLTVTATY